MRRHNVVERQAPTEGHLARERLLAGAPVTERRLQLAGASTAVLMGGSGSPVVLLHGQGGWAGMWLPVMAGLVSTHSVVAPDLPGLGASGAPDGELDEQSVLAWLAELVRTCATPPVLVGVSLGGSIAARFAARHREGLASLVLVDSGGLAGAVRPAPPVLLAMLAQSKRPGERSTLRMLRRVLFDLDGVRERMGERWEPFLAYLVDRACTPEVRSANRRLLREVGLPAIPPRDLERITVPTSLIHGRHDRVVPLRAAARVSDRYGWPLHVVDDAAHLPPVEEPGEVLDILREVLPAGSR